MDVTIYTHTCTCMQEVIQLHSRLRRRAEQVDKLQCTLTEKGLDRHFKKKQQQPLSGDLQQTLKENNYPSS